MYELCPVFQFLELFVHDERLCHANLVGCETGGILDRCQGIK